MGQDTFRADQVLLRDSPRVPHRRLPEIRLVSVSVGPGETSLPAGSRVAVGRRNVDGGGGSDGGGGVGGGLGMGGKNNKEKRKEEEGKEGACQFR